MNKIRTNPGNNVWSKVWSYILFVLFSALATGVDWLIMKYLGRCLDVSMTKILDLLRNSNIPCQIIPIMRCTSSFLNVLIWLGMIVLSTYCLSVKTADCIKVRDNLAKAQASMRKLVAILIVYLVCVSTDVFIAKYENILEFLINNAYTLSNVISYPVGVALAFYLCAKYAFNTMDHMKDRIRDTILVHLTGLVVQELLLYILIISIGKTEDYAKGVTIIVNAVLMSLSNILSVFRKRDNRIVIFAIFHKKERINRLNILTIFNKKERRNHSNRKKKPRRISLKELKHHLKRGKRKKKASA